MQSQVQVGIVLRPLVDNEVIDGAKKVVDAVGKHIVFNSIVPSTAIYEFDWAFDDSRTIYSSMISPLIESIFQGFTATVMAYGQTGSGKTHVMGSSIKDKNDALVSSLSTSTSIIPSSVNDIFLKKSQFEAKGAIVFLEMSYLEIYKEECYDLLTSLLIQQKNENKENQATPKNKKETEKSRSVIEMRENSKGETLLEGLSSWPVENQAEVNKLLATAARARVTGKTAMNARSSRSHAIATFSLSITTTENQNSSSSSTTVISSKLHLVDLAGSERVGETAAVGEVLREGVSINKGLLTLGKVVSALNEQQSRQPLSSSNGSNFPASHVPYRESKLTRLLKDALGGNGKTVILACISPADTQIKETLNTLRFAQRASAIINHANMKCEKTSQGLPPFICYHCGTQNPSDPSQMLSLKRAREEEILLDHNDISFDTSQQISFDLVAKDDQILELQEKLLQSENNLNRTNIQLAAIIKQSLKKPKKIKKNFMLRIADAVNCKTVRKDSTKSPEAKK